MKIIYLGYAVPKEKTIGNKAISTATNNMEIALLKAFKKQYLKDFTAISITPLQSFPGSSKKVFFSSNYEFGDGLESKAISFVNIPIIKQISQVLSIWVCLFKELIKYKKEKFKGDVVVITNNSKTIVSVPLFCLSKLFCIRSVCLVVDIPITFQEQRKKYLELAKATDNFVRLRNFKKYDAMITLVEQTVLDFAPGIPYITINYSIDNSEDVIDFESDCFIKHEEINLTFTGALESYYGIDKVLEMMEYLPGNYRLSLYGQGSLEQLIKEYALNDNRIKFYGLVTNKEAKKAQREADLLLLLRTDPELNKYGLPSKVVEYLSSGKPIIASKIQSVPYDMNQYLNVLLDEDPQKLAEIVQEMTVSSKIYESYCEKAKAGKIYISENCKWDIQAEKICRFLKEL